MHFAEGLMMGRMGCCRVEWYWMLLVGDMGAAKVVCDVGKRMKKAREGIFECWRTRPACLRALTMEGKSDDGWGLWQ